MFGKWKKRRTYKIIDFLAARKARYIVREIEKSHSKHVATLNAGTIETIETFRKQYDMRIVILEKEHDKALADIKRESDKKIKSMLKESDKIREEMEETIDHLSKEMVRISKREHIYERGFADITSELQRMLPQIRAALQAIQTAAGNIEDIHTAVRNDVETVKKGTKAEDIVRRNKLKAR